MLRTFSREQRSQNTRRRPFSNDTVQVSGGVSPSDCAPQMLQVVTT